MLRFCIVLLSLSLPAMADSQSIRAAEIESLSSTFGYADLLVEKNSHPQTAIVLDGCFVNFIEYFEQSASGPHAAVITDDLRLMPHGSNRNRGFTDDWRLDAESAGVLLFFATSHAVVIAEYRDLPHQPSPQDILSSKEWNSVNTDGAHYRNYWFPDTERVEIIADALTAYQSDYCKPGS